MIKKISLINIMLFLTGVAISQEYPDRHNTSTRTAWISCQTTTNPNPDRSASHWIQYDLGTTYALGQSTFWNLNAYEHTDEGVRDMQIDYSLDGVNWINFGRYSLRQADATSTYQGEAGPDFDGIVARYLLITSTSNYGGSCHGFSEFRVSSSAVTISSDETLVNNTSMSASPNPFSDQTLIEFDARDSEVSTCIVYDVAGKVVWSKQVQGGSFTFRPQDIPTGNYRMIVDNASGRQSIQLSIIK